MEEPAALSDTELQAAYKAYSDQIAREDQLYQNRINYSLIANGSMLVFYANVFNAKDYNDWARFFFLLVICGAGCAVTTVFERLLDRGFRRMEVLKDEFHRRLGVYASMKMLPMPALMRGGYVIYPASEFGMFLYAFWFVVVLMTIITVWGKAVEFHHG